MTSRARLARLGGGARRWRRDEGGRHRHAHAVLPPRRDARSRQWIAAGLVRADKRDAIIASLDARSGGGGAAVVASFGAILLAAAIISFVSANWGAISDAGHGAVAGVLAAAFGAAWRFYASGHKVFGDAFALVAAATFGASIFLIAQAFNISAHYPRGTLIWAIGALGTAWGVSVAPGARAGRRARRRLGVSRIRKRHSDALLVALLAVVARDRLGRQGAALAVDRAHARRRRRVLVGAHAVGAVRRRHDQRLEGFAIFGLVALTAVAASGDGVVRGRFGAGAVASWSALAAGVSGFFLQFGVREIETDPTTLWAVAAGASVVALVAVLGVRLARKTIDAPVAAAVGLAGVTFAASPRLTEALGHPVYAEMIVGAVFFAACVAAVTAARAMNGAAS